MSLIINIYFFFLNLLYKKFVLSGITEIDIDDWENNTEYEGYTKDDITIVNFWNVIILIYI